VVVRKLLPKLSPDERNDMLSLAAAATAGFFAPPPRRLPNGPLIIGYTGCDQQTVIREAVKGVNVIIWFASNLVRNATTGQPQVATGLNHTCVAEVAQKLRRQRLPTAHMLCVGGWDAPHPNTSFSGQQWFEAWDEWNQREAARPELGFAGYDGIDWDLEGNDAPASPWNRFSAATIALVGTMSQAMKRAGYLVSLVPPQSYADATDGGFDRSLLHSYADWRPAFRYRGRNAYMAWLSSRYAVTHGTVDGDVQRGGGVRTFDFVSVQLYESWSRASQAIDGPSQVPAAQYLATLARAYARGWHVDFGADAAVGIPSQTVAIPPDQLVLGFSFGSGPLDLGKSLFVQPEAVAAAWGALVPAERPRGMMFWNLGLDGVALANGTNRTCALAAGFNAFMHVRDG